MEYQLRIARRAEAYLSRLDARAQGRVLDRLRDLAADPLGPSTKALQNAGGRRSARVGGWRIIYSVDSERRIIDVSRIGPRGQIYRDR